MESALAIASSNDAVDFVTVTLGLIFTQYTRHILQTICIVCCCGLLVYDPSRTKKEQHWKHNFAAPTMIFVYVDIIYPIGGVKDMNYFTIVLLCITILGCIGNLLKQRKDVNIGSLAGCTYVVALFYTIYTSYPNFFTACLLALISGCILAYKREYITMNLTMRGIICVITLILMDTTKRQRIYITSGMFILICPNEWKPPTSLLLTFCTIDAFVCERDYIRASWKAPCALFLLIMNTILYMDTECFIIIGPITNVIGCIYLMVLEHKCIRDSTMFHYSMLIMIYIIYRIRYPEPEVTTFFGVIIGCVVCIGSGFTNWYIGLDSQYYTILSILYIIPIAYFAMDMHLIGVCLWSYLFVLPCVWTLGVVGNDRIDIFYRYGALWDGYDCDHCCKSSGRKLPIVGFFGNFLMNIITHADSRNTLCKYEGAGYLGLCIIGAPLATGVYEMGRASSGRRYPCKDWLG